MCRREKRQLSDEKHYFKGRNFRVQKKREIYGINFFKKKFRGKNLSESKKKFIFTRLFFAIEH